MTTTGTPEQIAFQKAVVELTLAERKVNDLAASLPPLPADFEGEGYIVEHGYSRYENLEVSVDEGGQLFHGWTRGWDAMSESGSAEHIEIELDGLPYAMPADLDWD